MAKRKTLPKDFDQLLRSAPLDELKAVFDKCLIDARGSYAKHTAIGFVECPDSLITWLVEQGLDVDAVDDYGATPLWERADLGRAAQIPLLLSLGADIERERERSGTPLHGAAGRQRPEATRVLLEHGANVHAKNGMGQTPLLHALQRTNNADIAGMAQVAKLLIAAGAVVTDEMREAVERIGKDFEFHRERFNPDLLDKTQAGLTELYRLFGATPVAALQRHDGVSPIKVPAGKWHEQHQALWELLVPSQGAAATVQGEVIRLTGKIAREILDNGSPNWDGDFKAMLAVIPVHLGSGTPLPADELREAQSLAKMLRSGDGDDRQVYRMSELAVAWVISNPAPVALVEPEYRR
ncbi:ankyrin repeat domain-containing protein [Lysobacter terrae]